MIKSDKKSRHIILKILLALVILAAVYIGKNVYDICAFSTVDEACRADTAIILGAAVYGDEPSPVYRERINHGITQYHEGYADRLIVTGGSPDDSEKTEAAVAKEYLISQGIPAEDILTEDQSSIMQENLENAKVIMDGNHLETAVIVSDPLHMKRAMLLAEDAGITAYSSPTPTTRYISMRTKIPFLARETFYYIGYQWYGCSFKEVIIMIHTIKFMDNFYIFDNGMVRQFLITGADEAILIDTGFAEDHVREAVSAVTDLPVRVIMTHGDPDHAGGLSDFGTCRIHREDWHLLPDGIEPEPLAEGDVFECGGYRLETIEIPGHTYGSAAFFDREKGLLLPGDSVQKDGPIYMFGSHRNLDLYIESQKKLCGLADEVKTIIPCHHDYPIGPEYISRNLEDAIAMRNGELPGTPHPEMPCITYQGKWTAFYGERND